MANLDKTDEMVENREPSTDAQPVQAALVDLPMNTEIYTGDDIDTLFRNLRIGTDKILIRDEDYPDQNVYYTLTVKSGQLVVRKLVVQPSNG